MQKTFGHLALSHRPFFVPRGFWLSFKDYDGEPTNVREHQDAYEFFTRLQACPLHPTMRNQSSLPAASKAEKTGIIFHIHDRHVSGRVNGCFGEP